MSRQVYRLGPHAALAVNHKLIDAVALAALAWAALAASIVAAIH
jgi:hypothetical protein